ncbi:MAG: hypothetical protein ACI350_03875 [Prevotella sp.]
MANIKHFEMAESFAINPNISIRKSFFGLFQTVIYNPTQSPIQAVLKEYTMEMGQRVERLLECPDEQLEERISKSEKIEEAQIGNMRLEACVSRDRQFAAYQLFRFSDFKYQPVTRMKVYEGKAAELISAEL